MKKLVITIVTILGLCALVAIGCTNEALVGVSPEEEAVNSCVTCHTDKEILQAVAVEVEKAQSEATTGEG